MRAVRPEERQGRRRFLLDGVGQGLIVGRPKPAQSFRDRLRRSGISPAIWGAYAYLRAGGPFKGRASRAYAEERMVFEALLARLLAGPEPASRILS